jgi:CheY-like chemotaxis protein
MNIPTKVAGPAILIFDDDPAILEWARTRFHGATSLGVVAAESLAEAWQLIHEQRVRFSAIVSDISVAPGKHDLEHRLQSGLDLLEEAARIRPDIPVYALSIWSDEKKLREQAKERGIKIKRWFQKLSSEPFWTQIENELLADCDQSKRRPSVFARVFGTGTVQNKPHPITRTYLQLLPSGYEVVTPIEVVCHSEDGLWEADSPTLGLLEAGVGETLEEALENLGEIIVDQYETLKSAVPTEISGYAAATLDSLRAHVRRKVAEAA